METYPKLKIIIADDHKFFRSGFDAVLKSFRYVEKVSQAENGRQVIELLEKDSYDIVFMDVNMPELNGTEATGIITIRFPTVKVIALSMHDEKENIIEILNKGAMGYILKNTDKDEIGDAIKEVISGNQYFSNDVSNILYKELKSKTENNSFKPISDSQNKDRLRNVIFLLCYEFNNLEIGEILFLSTRTVETYRRDAIRKIGCKGTAGVVKYGIESGIYKDPELLKRFGEALKRNEK